MNHDNIKYLVIDWGTSNFRAFALDENNQLIDRKALNQGLLEVPEGAFAEALESILKNWIHDYRALPIYMAGMVGSAKGWVNVDYVSTPVGVQDLLEKAYQSNLPWGPQAIILPGVSHSNKNSNYEVMRGEELQVFGLAKSHKLSDFSAILPGTHSKHVDYVDDKIQNISTFMTGELYSILSKHSILGKGFIQTSVASSDAFRKGVMDSQDGELSNRLFLTRTSWLFKQISEDGVLDYLSGMLIGFELRCVKQQAVFLVGSPQLCARYELACEQLKIQAQTVDGDECFLAGMNEIYKENSK